MVDIVSTLLGAAVNAAGTYAANNVRIAVKTNLGPEITVYDPAAGDAQLQPGLLQQLGLQTAIIVYDMNGNILSTFGAVPQTDPIKAGIALAVLLVGLFALIRGVLPKGTR